jgi:2-oxo-4-hydroxy-4-carboxy-5-ureidoimidazoline decarboxylase
VGVLDGRGESRVGSVTMDGLARFNNEEAGALTTALLACCDVPAWAGAVVAGRPYSSVADLIAEADAAARRLSRDEVGRALAAHPRIGERAQGSGTEAGWSRQEQSTVSRDERTQQELLEGNRAYEERFGQVFLICATGLGGDEILASLRERLGNDEDAEAAVVAEELRKIALLRLHKLVEEGAQS